VVRDALKRLSLLLGIVLAATQNPLAACGGAGAISRADSPPARYFPETGHYVGQPFLDFFTAQGGADIFGYPISEPFAQDGRTVQYFQQSRLEFHPENPRPYQVELSLLNELLGRRTPPLPATGAPPAGRPQQRYYHQTGHSLSFAFLHFFDAHGGLDTFGYPISEPFVEEGAIAQDFQRARFTWRPGYPPGERVRLAPLGEAYFQERGLDPALLAAARPVAPGAYPLPSSPALQVEATLAQLAVSAGRLQHLQVRVKDGQGHGLSGVRGAVVLHFPGGASTYPLPPTDAAGLTHVLLAAGGSPPGTLVCADIVVSGEGQGGFAQTAFLLR
jgi:hypothetical protein